GVEKMSKSLGNHIGIAEPPDVMFGKTMSVPDAALRQYLELASDLPNARVAELVAALDAGSVNPSHVKRELVRDIVGQFHGEGAAREAEAAFDRIFVAHELPAEIDVLDLPGRTSSVVDAMQRSGLVASRSEARRLLRQGAVEFEGERLSEEHAELSR